MIPKESLNELANIVAQDPTRTCVEFSEGMMFAVRDGDTSCLVGETKKSGEVEVNGQKFTIFIGGSIKK